MIVEKINENKIKITLTLEELESHQISLHDIEKNSALAQSLFIDLVEESNLEEDFLYDDSQFFIEAFSDNNNLFIMTITKVDNLPDIKKYSQFEGKKINTKNKKRDIQNDNYKISSNVYKFSTIDDILSICTISKKENMFFGRNSLYKYNNSYFLIFNKTSIKNKRFLKTFVFLSEYCSNYYSYDIFETTVKEKSTLIIKNNALQKLSKLDS